MKGKIATKGSIPALAVVGVMAAAGVGYAAIPGPDGVIHSCYNAAGQLRVIDADPKAACSKNEKALAFNQRGPRGPKGDPGDPGPRGERGPSDLYIAENREGFVSSTDVNAEILLDVPAGSYLIRGQASISSRDADDIPHSPAYCNFAVPAGPGEDPDRSGYSGFAQAGPEAGATVVPVQGAATYDAPTTLRMVCYTYNGEITRMTLTALKVATIHEQAP